MQPWNRRIVPIVTALAVAMALAVPAFAAFSSTRTHCDVADIVPTAIAAGDFNGNGEPGLAVTEDEDSGSGIDVSVWHNEDPFDCTTEKTLSLPADRKPRGGIAAGDVYGNGADEVAAVGIDSANTESYLWVFENDGSGSFSDGSNADEYTIDVGEAPADVALADFNGNGSPGAVVANEVDDSISVFTHTGVGGVLGLEGHHSTGKGAKDPNALAIADVDQDGDPDIITANKSTDDISIFENDGNGSFSEFQASPQDVAGSTPLDVAVGDFDGQDGPDVVTADSDSTQVSAMVNLGVSGGSWNGFDDTAPVTKSTEFGPESVAAGDWTPSDSTNLDGIAAISGQDLAVWDNNGSGGFTEQTNSPYDVGSWKPRDVTAADVDGDGALDLNTAVDMDNTVSVVHN